MKLFPTLIALVLVTSSATAMPPPAKPHSTIPNVARVQMVWEFEGNLSQALGAPVKLTSVRSYDEQDGSNTMCVTGRVSGHRLRVVFGSASTTLTQPTPAQWTEAGCERPGYLLLR